MHSAMSLGGTIEEDWRDDDEQVAGRASRASPRLRLPTQAAPVDRRPSSSSSSSLADSGVEASQVNWEQLLGQMNSVFRPITPIF
jgi:hypothetical protein